MSELKVKSEDSITIEFAPDHNITFSNSSGIVGKLDFNGDELKFTGNADESAKALIKFVSYHFTERFIAPWPFKGVRVDDQSVIILANDNDAARFICGEILAAHKINKSKV